MQLPQELQEQMKVWKPASNVEDMKLGKFEEQNWM